jgi:hypothetical protein
VKCFAASRHKVGRKRDKRKSPGRRIAARLLPSEIQTTDDLMTLMPVGTSAYLLLLEFRRAERSRSISNNQENGDFFCIPFLPTLCRDAAKHFT